LVANPIIATVTQGNSASYGNVTVNMGGGSGNCTVTLVAGTQGTDTGLPAGASPVFGTGSFTGASGSSFTSTVSVSTSSTTSPGTYTFRVAALRGANCQGSGAQNSTQQLTLVVNANPVRATTTTVTSSANPSTYGNNPTFTATVAATGGNPSNQGTVTFKDGTTTLCSGVALSSGQASCAPTSALGVGSHSITADYSGSSSSTPQFGASTSSALSQTVNPKSITGSFTADNKTYDGNNSATVLTRSVNAADVVGSDVVTLTGGTATFANKDVGNGKTVTLTGASLGGADAANYNLTSVNTTTANITAKQLTGSFTANNKPYDGNTNATVASTSLPGVISPDVVNLVVTNAQFDNKNVANGKTVTADLALSGAQAGNYSLSSNTASTTANITAKGITGSFTAANKVYDGNNSATITGRNLSGVINPDVVTLTGGTATFDNANVGANKTVTGTGFTLTGADAGNYTLASSTLTTTASILYAPATSTCLGSPGHTILQPINPASGIDSVFKQGSTVPAKFRVCDVNGNSIGTPGVVTSFKLVKTISGTESAVVNEPVDSTTPDSAFRWSATDQQWIFNMNTKSLKANQTYVYQITLADTTTIDFQFGLK